MKIKRTVMRMTKATSMTYQDLYEEFVMHKKMMGLADETLNLYKYNHIYFGSFIDTSILLFRATRGRFMDMQGYQQKGKLRINSLENQEKLLRANGAVEIYKDSFTGTKRERPAFNKLINVLKEGDTVKVTKLDRIARSMTQGSKLVTELIEKGIKVHILNIGIMDNTPSSKLIRNVFFTFAEFERDMIVERTQEGKAIAKTKAGFKEGRPKKYTQEQLDHALGLLEKYSYTQVEKMTRISKSTLIREKRLRKVSGIG